MAAGRPSALIIAGVALSPFWARDVAPLLPWGGASRAPIEDYAAFAARLEAIERRPVRASRRCRRGQFGDRARWRAGSISWKPRATRIGKAKPASAAAKAGLQQVEERLSAIEAQSGFARRPGRLPRSRKCGRSWRRSAASPPILLTG